MDQKTPEIVRFEYERVESWVEVTAVFASGETAPPDRFPSLIEAKQALERVGYGDFRRGRSVWVSEAWPTTPQSGICRICGCTDERACPEICSWVDATHTLCSSCATGTIELKIPPGLDPAELKREWEALNSESRDVRVLP